MSFLKGLTGGLAGAGLGFLTGGPGGALAGGLAGFGSAYGASQQAGASQDMAREQMKFQREMSSTAHQRQVKDLKKAGLNPILSTNSGASSPGGAMGQAQNITGSAVTSALNATLMKSQIAKINAETGLTNKQSDSIDPFAKGGAAIGSLADYLTNHAATTAAQIQKWTNQYFKDKSDINPGGFNKSNTKKKGSIEKIQVKRNGKWVDISDPSVTKH
nr:MAG: DNA pilot protein [Microvirus sp.]